MKPKSKLRKIVVITGLILLILILLSVGYRFINSIVASSHIASSREAAKKTLDLQLEKTVDLLEDAGAVGSQLGTSKADVCYLAHNDSGWIATSWYQECYLRYVYGFSAKLERKEVVKALAKQANTETYLGTPTLSAAAYSCDLFEKDYSTTLTYLTPKELPDDYTCKVPELAYGIGRIPSYAKADLSVKSYESFDKSAVAITEKQLWIEFQVHYYEEDLGCGAIGLFCDSPRNTPVHPSL